MSILREVRVPNLGNASASAIIAIPVQLGDAVLCGDALVTLESDKASMDVPSPYAGKIKAIKVQLGDKVSSGDLIVLMETDAAALDEEEHPGRDGKQAGDELDLSQNIQKERLPQPSAMVASVPDTRVRANTAALIDGCDEDDTERGEGDSHAGPGVRRLAQEFGLDLHQITGTGQKGRVVKEDLQRFVKDRMQAGNQGVHIGLPIAPLVDFNQFGETQAQPLSRIKKLTAQNLHRNWLLVPHVTQFNEADITELEAFRKAQSSFAAKQAVKLTPLAFIMKAVVTTLKVFPAFNASLSPDGEQLILKKYFNIGVAVDTPEGLVVPVIRDVVQKSLLELAKELSEVSQKARTQQLSSVDMQGSSFTISSLGGIGGTAFTPIINVPDVAILGVSTSQYKPRYQAGEWMPRLMLPLSLSYDHRVIDGAEGARFVVHLAECLSDIRRWLL